MSKEISIEKLKSKDIDVFHDLYKNYSKIIFRFALNMTNDKEFSEDIVQETFIRVYSNMDSFKWNKKLKNPIKSWIYRIAQNYIISELRKSSKRKHTDLDEVYKFYETERYKTENDFINSEDVKKIYKEVNKLSHKKKLTFNLFFVEELTADEISLVMNEGRGTILKRIQRIRKELKSLFEEEEWMKIN